MGKVADTTELLSLGGLAHMGLRRILQGIVLALKPKVIAEIGVFRGHSTCVMALSGLILKKQLKFQPKIFAVDPVRYGQRPLVRKYAKDADVKFIFKRAQDVNVNEVKLPIDVLFIDGDHTYEATKEIFEKWVKWVRPGGIVVMHDICVEGPIKSTPGREYGVKKYWEEIDLPKVTLVDTKPGIGVVMVPKVEEPIVKLEPKEETTIHVHVDPVISGNIREKINEIFEEKKPEEPPDSEPEEKLDTIPSFSTPITQEMKDDAKPSEEWDAGATDMEAEDSGGESEEPEEEKEEEKPKRKYTHRKGKKT